MVDNSKVSALVTALKNTFLQAKNKVTEWSGTPSNDKIPSEKLVKDSLDAKVDTTKIFKNGVFTTENVKANGTKATIWNESDGGGAMIIDGTSNVKAFTGVNEGSDGSNIYVQSYALDKDSKTGTRINVNQNGAYYTSNKSTSAFTADDEILTKGKMDLAIGGLSSDYYNKTVADEKFQTIEDGEVAIVEKSSANNGAFKTYQITQGGTAVSGEIDIPKDFLVKSGSVKTAGSTLTEDEEDAGVEAGEKYISLIINSADDDSQGGTELIIPASGLVEDTTYTADETTITLSGTEFSIPSNVVDSWLTDGDVEDTVEDYIESITTALNE